MMPSKRRGTLVGPQKNTFFCILLTLSTVAPGLAAEDPRDEIEARHRTRAATAADRHARRVDSAAFFRRFRHVVEALGLPQDQQPTNLFDLSSAIGQRPELLPEFLRVLAEPLAKSASRRDASIQRYAEHLQKRIDRIDQRLGPRPTEIPELEYLETLLKDLDPESYSVSGPFEPRPPGVVDVAPVEIDPIQFHSVKIQDVIADGLPFDFYCTGQSTCQWPHAYDLIPPQIYLFWRTTTLGLADLQDIIAQQGHSMALSVNGKLLVPGPMVSYGKAPGDPAQGYWAIAMSEKGESYIVTAVLARDVLSVGTLPWTFNLEIYDVEPLTIPEIIGIDENGNPLIAHDKLVLMSHPAVTFSANGTNATSYFEAMLYPTFQSDRCTDCHSFNTIAKLAAHHKHDADGFAEYTHAELEPSAYDPSGHVIVCNNCHDLQHIDTQGHSFTETEWKAPFEDLDVDWKVKNAVEICDRVTDNLPTPELRHEHFHGDARLFWAIESPYVMGRLLDPPAEPRDFDEFLRRVDTWNDAGAPCP